MVSGVEVEVQGRGCDRLGVELADEIGDISKSSGLELGFDGRTGVGGGVRCGGVGEKRNGDGGAMSVDDSGEG